MVKTNWNHCSRLLVALLVLAVVAAPAAAVSVAEEDVPQEAQVESQVTATVTLNELYMNPQLESWQLTGETALKNVSWTVAFIDQTGSKVDQVEQTGQNLSAVDVAADEGVAEVRLTVTGTVPPVEEYRYDPPQTFQLLSLTQTQEGGASTDIDEWEAHHFTAESDGARTALDEASTAIDEADANTDEAETTLAQATRAYESENFDLATELANEATAQAESAQQSSQLVQTLLYVGAGVLVLLVLVGGFLYWRSQQDTYDKLG